jgi:predicted acylesterase/phospholipase RssA
MPGLRVLVLDGGGSKGYFTLEILRHIELCCGGKPIRECFDLIVGTSVGALIAASIVAGKEVADMQDQWLSIAALLEKAYPSLRSYASRLLWGHVLDAEVWESKLSEHFGDMMLADLPESPRLLMVATDATAVVPHPFLIRNRPLPESVAHRSPFETSSTMRVANAVRATTAAPTVYPAHVEDGTPLVDGGILACNPVLFALAEANLLGSLDCIVSVGCGRETRDPSSSPHRGVLAWTWATIRRSMDPDTPEMLAEGILPPSQYFRLNTPFAGDVSCWEASPDVLNGWRSKVQAYLYDQTNTLADLVPRLCREIPPAQDNEDGSVSNTGGPGRVVPGEQVS